MNICKAYVSIFIFLSYRNGARIAEIFKKPLTESRTYKIWKMEMWTFYNISSMGIL